MAATRPGTGSSSPQRPSGPTQADPPYRGADAATHGLGPGTILGHGVTTDARPYRIADVGSLYPPVPSSGGINKVAQDIEATADIIAGANNVLPIVYGGPVKLGPLIVGIVGNTAGSDTYLNITGLLSHGPISAITAVYLDDKANVEGMTFAGVLGTPDQTPLAALVSAYAQHGITYTDAMPGVAYVNVKLKAGMPLSNVPRLNVVVNGRLLFDMRTGTTAYSANPVLALADFIKSPVYGAGKDYDVASFSECADWNDSPVVASANEPLRRIALAITNKETVDEWISVLAVYANVDLYQFGGIYYATPRRAKASSYVFNDSNIVSDSVQIARTPARQVPTISVVRYTDTTVLPWSTRDCPPAMLAGVETNSLPARDMTISLPGITRVSQAGRDALERLNWNIYGNTSFAWVGYDEAAGVRKGDVVTFSHAIGIANKLVWINERGDLGFGRYQFRGTGYDPLIFAGTPPSSISPIDSSILIPGLVPPAVQDVVGREEIYQKQNGEWDSRVRFEWSMVGSQAAFDHFALAINDVTTEETAPGSQFQVDSRNTALPSMVTYALQEGRKYRLYVVAVSVLGIASAAAESNVVHVLGKLAPPGDVPGFTGTEAGGTVYLRWGKAIDLDVERYEIRRGTVGSAWTAKTMVAVCDALAAILPGQPAGTQEYSIKAIDSVGNYSVNPATISILVTVDSGQVALSFEFQTYQPTNMQAVPHPTYDYTTTNVALASAGGVANAQTSHVSGSYSPALAINGNRAATTGSPIGFWNSADATVPVWWQVLYGTAKHVDTVVVYSYFAAGVPNDTDTSPEAIKDFTVSAWVNGAWVVVATVTGNTLAKRTVKIAPVLTYGIVINITALTAGDTFARLAEVEVYSVPAPNYGVNANLAAAGTTASASSTYTPGPYTPDLAINGVTAGAGGQYWNSANLAPMPQWWASDFHRTRTINKVVVYGLQDGFVTTPPTDATVGTQYLPTAFDVLVAKAGAWVKVASVVGNNLVKRTITFPPEECQGVQIFVTASQSAWASLVEVEAWTPARTAAAPYYTVNWTGMWQDGADVPNNAVGTFDDSLKDNLIGFPTAPDASQLTTGVLDQGSVLEGRWSFMGTANIVDSLAGAPFNDSLITRAIDYSSDGINFIAGASDTVFAARYLRLRATCPTGYVMRALQDFTLNFSTTLREERGTAVLDATGRVTVNLTGKYARYVTIQLTVMSGGTGRFAVYDAVVIGSGVTNKFDIVLFNSANAQVAGTVGWLFQGLN